MELWWLLILVGVACGIYSSMFGVGAGTLMIPILVLIFALPQKSAQGLALAVMVPMVLVGAIRYKMNPAIDMDLRIAAWLAVGGVVGAWVGSHIAHVLPAVTLRRVFAVVIVLLAIRMFFKTETRKEAAADQSTPAVESTSPPG